MRIGITMKCLNSAAITIEEMLALAGYSIDPEGLRSSQQVAILCNYSEKIRLFAG